MRFVRVLVAVVLASAAPAFAAERAGRPRPTSSAPLAALEAWLAQPPSARADDAPALRLPLDRASAERALALLTRARMAEVAATARGDLAARRITRGERTLRWEERTFGDAPWGKRSLWISLHGGGNAPPALNDRQWRNQVRLYEPGEGIYLAPRAPTDTWNLWHEAHIDPLFQRLIDAQVAINGVDPNRVYLLGYSAGGDGVWQLAPRMADRFAAAAMMAGHPNDASLLPLRNLPFAIFMGGADAAYDRNAIAAARSAELDRLAKADPGGYVHMTRIYPGLPHWMDGKDKEALPWMARFTRRAWPGRVVWVRGEVPAERLYWLQVAHADALAKDTRIDARVDGQRFVLDGQVPSGVTLRLSDRLVDLDRPVTVTVNGRVRFQGRVPRTARAIRQSLTERTDPDTAATALLVLDWYARTGPGHLPGGRRA